MEEGQAPHHILVLTDRDWTHPQAGGTGTNLRAQVVRWLAWGLQVTVVSGAYPGCAKVERPEPNLELHHMGSRLTVFPRAFWAVKRKLARDADVVLEIVNGIAFFTPLWRLRRPRVVVVHHVHRDMYVAELGRRGALAAWLLEALPLRFLYGGTPFITGSKPAREGLLELGLPAERIRLVYHGVEPEAFHDGERAAIPTLLYVGRLKRYKRLEILLDVVEALPDVRLEVAGEGDHRVAFEEEVRRRGLEDRVRLHGFVDEERKRELCAAAWVALTASSAEGWCLTVMEAGACGTPTAALRVGGLAESVVHGETGLLADDSAELIRGVREIVESPSLRDRLGEAARRRARRFTWDDTATGTLAALRVACAAPRETLRATLRRVVLQGPAGVAAATLIANAAAVVLTMLLARRLGVADYGALAALASAFLILSVPGTALQLAAAREVSAGRRVRWDRGLAVGGLVVAAAAVLAREPIAGVAGVDHPWAAAALLPTGVLWLATSLQRGALQGLGAHGAVAASLLGETVVRVVAALALVAAGAGVTGAFLATPLGMAVAAAGLAWTVRRRSSVLGVGAGASGVGSTVVPAARGLEAGTRSTMVTAAPGINGSSGTGSTMVAGGAAEALGAAVAARPGDAAYSATLRRLLGATWLPLAALTLLALVQYADVIVIRHRLGEAAAGDYAAAALASKVIVWVAAGLALAILPEISRHARTGARDRALLVRALGLVALLALPMVAASALAGESLLRAVFGPELAGAADALPWLAVAMSLFACALVAVQHMLALGRRAVLPVIGIAAVAEPFLLRGIGAGPADIAVALALLQLVLAAALIALGLRAAARGLRPEMAR
jgi:glycosyltransferase involved in cell wall biosynthesis/O-antigen/teichoic acid export membrane protein